MSSLYEYGSDSQWHKVMDLEEMSLKQFLALLKAGKGYRVIGPDLELIPHGKYTNVHFRSKSKS